MPISQNILLEEDIEIASLVRIIKDSGRNILEIDSDHFWIEGNEFTNIQIGHVKNKRSICIFAGCPLSDDITGVECALLANRLNVESDVARFYVRFSEFTKQYVLFVDHYIFYTEALITSQFFTALQFVEFYALEFDITPYYDCDRTLN